MSDSISYIGIDVSKAHLDIYVLPVEQHWQLANTEQAIKALSSKRLPPNEEASGGYKATAARLLYQAGLPVCRVNPQRIRHFARSLGLLAKTDRLDSKVLVLFAQRIQPPVTAFASPQEEQLSALLTRRRQLLDNLVAERNRLETAHPAARRSKSISSGSKQKSKRWSRHAHL
ncbi:MAG: transposase [Roseiflexus sp.]|jgi:transposase|nr:transposase [Roseiflexus sp.]MBO9336754.1 transposase [Roseiflexus sp.]MBO9364609.1 transposase [Roseiflexus sp.]MBO9383472.1 transposase [Roseiflexus sp.]MBO9388450.1 transposase [Roseiflexus sp.]